MTYPVYVRAHVTFPLGAICCPLTVIVALAVPGVELAPVEPAADELKVLSPVLGDPVGANARADELGADELDSDEWADELEVLPPVKTNLYTNTPATANTAMAAMTRTGIGSRCGGDPTDG
jgi:hypothetical protein